MVSKYSAPHTNLVRYLPYAGLAILLVACVAFAALLSASRTQALAVLAGLGTLFYGGKEAGLPVGMAAGANPILLGAFIFLIDVAFTCFFYPPLHYAIRNWMAHPGVVGRYLRYLRQKAAKREGLVAKYGTIGLFLFMLIPFAINGPLVGALIGRLLGLRARQIVPTLILAIGFTTIAWTAIYALGFLLIATIDPMLPKIITAVVLAVVLGHAIWGIIQMRRMGRPPESPRIVSREARDPQMSIGAAVPEAALP